MQEQAIHGISDQNRRSLKRLAILCGILLAVDLALILYLIWGTIFPKPVSGHERGVAAAVVLERPDQKASPYKQKSATLLARARSPRTGL